MSIEDTDPHRRNLVVLSISILAFSIGGGHIDKDEKLKLAFINVQMDNPKTLAIMAICILFWFAFRYWQKCPNVIAEIRSDIKRAIFNHPELKTLCEDKVASWKEERLAAEELEAQEKADAEALAKEQAQKKAMQDKQYLENNLGQYQASIALEALSAPKNALNLDEVFNFPLGSSGFPNTIETAIKSHLDREFEHSYRHYQVNIDQPARRLPLGKFFVDVSIFGYSLSSSVAHGEIPVEDHWTQQGRVPLGKLDLDSDTQTRFTSEIRKSVTVHQHALADWLIPWLLFGTSVIAIIITGFEWADIFSSLSNTCSVWFSAAYSWSVETFESLVSATDDWRYDPDDAS